MPILFAIPPRLTVKKIKAFAGGDANSGTHKIAHPFRRLGEPFASAFNSLFASLRLLRGIARLRFTTLFLGRLNRTSLSRCEPVAHPCRTLGLGDRLRRRGQYQEQP